MSLPPKELLPPGPWKTDNVTVTDGYGNPIAVVVSKRRVADIAAWIAALPDLIVNEKVPELLAKIENHEKEIARLEDAIEKLEERLAFGNEATLARTL